LLDRPEALRYLRPKLSRQDNAGRKALLSVRIAAPLLLACWFSGCAATRVAETGVPDGGPAGRLEAALERAVDDSATRDSLHLFVECRRERGAGSVELFGNGVGIWNGRRQFRAAAPVVTAALEALRDHGFAAMPETFGGKGSDLSQPPKPGVRTQSGSAVQVVCRIEVEIAGFSRMVAQLGRGYQSPTFRTLALEILSLCEEPARTGVEAADLADGLTRLAAHDLAPETFHLLLNRRPEEASADGPGFLLRIDGLEVTVRPFDPSSGYGTLLRMRLRPEELAGLAGELVRAGAQELPINLWADVYTDISLTVLGHEREIQARRFAGMEPSTHGEHQQSFDRIYASLGRLAARALVEGREDRLE
jgi:hypothetical protein